MKGSLYFFVLWLGILNGPAARAQVNWGLVAGGSLVSLYPHKPSGSNPLWQYDPGSYSFLLTWLAGAAAEVPVNRHWSLDASLSYDGSGTHAVYGFSVLDASQISKLNIRLGYLRLPLQAIYQFNPGHRVRFLPGQRVRFLAGGGLYGAVGLRAHEKGSMTGWYLNSGPQTSSIDNRVTFTNKVSTANATFYPSAVRPLDAGYTVMAGVQWQHFRLSPSFSQGFVSLFPDGVFKGKNKSISLSLLYWIHKG